MPTNNISAGQWKLIDSLCKVILPRHPRAVVELTNLYTTLENVLSDVLPEVIREFNARVRDVEPAHEDVTLTVFQVWKAIHRSHTSATKEPKTPKNQPIALDPAVLAAMIATQPTRANDVTWIQECMMSMQAQTHAVKPVISYAMPTAGEYIPVGENTADRARKARKDR